MENTTTSLTEKEYNLLARIAGGMDEAGCGWLHEFADESHETAGTLGSLVKKGLVLSSVVRERGMSDCTWVDITPAGIEAVEAGAPNFRPYVRQLESLGFKDGGISNRGCTQTMTIGNYEVDITATRNGYNWDYSLVSGHRTDEETGMAPETANLPSEEDLEPWTIEDLMSELMPRLFCVYVAEKDDRFRFTVEEPDCDHICYRIYVVVNDRTIFEGNVSRAQWGRSALIALTVLTLRD